MKLTEIQKVLLGKGMLTTTKPVHCAPWRGMEKPANPPFSAAGVAENRKLYPHLFRSDR
jgi:hypothetical protein